MFVSDNHINNELYERVLLDSTFFPESMGGGERIATELNSYHYEQASCFAPYMFWDGWWRSPANTLRKEVVQAIWENHLPCPKEEIIGFEYWTRTYMAGQFLDIHVDEDTFLYEDEKIFAGPKLGSIWYGVDNKEGGFVEFHNAILVDGTPNAIERHSVEHMLSPIEERERIAYRGNRVIIFDAGHQIHATTPAKSGIRQVMVVNLWHQDNPPTALAKQKFYYE